MKQNTRVRLAGLLALAGAAAAVQLAAAPVASAAGYNLTNTPLSWSTSTSQYEKYASVMCPQGKVILGGSGYIQGDYGTSQSVKLSGVVQFVSGGQYGLYVHAVRDNPAFTGAWNVAAYGVCSNPLPGYEIVVNSTSSTNTSWSTGASCGAGNSVYAAGGWVAANVADRVTLSGTYPYGGSQPGVSAWGHTVGGANVGSWSVGSIAICARPLPGYAINYASKGPVSDPGEGSVLAGCFANTVSYGGGGWVSSAGEARMYHHYTHSEPSFNWTVTDATPAVGDTNSYYVGAITICAAG